MPEIFGDYLNKYTYNYLETEALKQVDDSIDKRQGSIIFDATAPSNYMLALGYLDMKWVLQQAFASTSTGAYLDLHLSERGLTREVATQAVKKCVFIDTADNPALISIGTVFQTVDTTGGINYTVTSDYVDPTTGDIELGSYNLTCVEYGVIGNTYTGPIIPVVYINNLKSATMDIVVIPGQDKESDPDAYERYEIKVNQPPFGGNFSDYKLNTLNYPGVGQVQIYPTWNGGGTVKMSVIDIEYKPVSQSFLDALKIYYDPADVDGNHGNGLGKAPVGHVVSCSTATVKQIAVAITVKLKPGVTIPQVSAAIKISIENYFKSVTEGWGSEESTYKNYSLAVYRSNMIAYILGVAGVATVTGILLNELSQDIILTENKTTQEIPILDGDPTITEGV